MAADKPVQVDLAVAGKGDVDALEARGTYKGGMEKNRRSCRYWLAAKIHH